MIIIAFSILLSVCSNVSGSSSSSFGATVISSILKSPLYAPIVLLARNTMVKTAQNAGLDWPGKAARLRTEFFANNAPTPEDIMNENPTLITEDYYKSKFHGYANGNLCLEAAIEQEIAGKAVGARNFPAEGLNGEVIKIIYISTAMCRISVYVLIECFARMLRCPDTKSRSGGFRAGGRCRCHRRHGLRNWH
jgi:hypothetical protein